MQRGCHVRRDDRAQMGMVARPEIDRLDRIDGQPPTNNPINPNRVDIERAVAVVRHCHAIFLGESAQFQMRAHGIEVTEQHHGWGQGTEDRNRGYQLQIVIRLVVKMGRHHGENRFAHRYPEQKDLAKPRWLCARKWDCQDLFDGNATEEPIAEIVAVPASLNGQKTSCHAKHATEFGHLVVSPDRRANLLKNSQVQISKRLGGQGQIDLPAIASAPVDVERTETNRGRPQPSRIDRKVAPVRIDRSPIRAREHEDGQPQACGRREPASEPRRSQDRCQE